MGIPKLLAAFAGQVSKALKVGSNSCGYMQKFIATMPILDACKTATGTVRQKRGRKDDEHGIGDKRPKMESVGADFSVSSKPKTLHPKVAINLDLLRSHQLSK